MLKVHCGAPIIMGAPDLFCPSSTRLMNGPDFGIWTSIPVGWIAVSIWGVAVGSGFVLLTSYQNAPGSPAEAPAQWPADSGLEPASQGATLLVFVHPHCPCTDATMEELARLMRHVRDTVRAHAVFLQPEQVDPGWVTTSLWRRAESVAGVTPRPDPAGRETDRFGVATSGQVLLYGPEGSLRFQGGITAGRGHEGDNAGRTALRTLLSGGRPAETETFVFGCSMHQDGTTGCIGGMCLR